MFKWIKRLFEKKIPLTLVITNDTTIPCFGSSDDVYLTPQWNSNLNIITLSLPDCYKKDTGDKEFVDNLFISKFIFQIKKALPSKYKIKNIINLYEIDCIINDMFINMTSELAQHENCDHCNCRFSYDDDEAGDRYDEMDTSCDPIDDLREDAPTLVDVKQELNNNGDEKKSSKKKKSSNLDISTLMKEAEEIVEKEIEQMRKQKKSSKKKNK